PFLDNTILPYIILKIYSRNLIYSILEKSDHQCGFSEYIERTIEAHKQKYRLFACFFSWKKKFLNFSSQNATAPPVLSRLRAKRGERSRDSYQLAPFQGWKGGEQ
ncbi:hypothetical protein, partial [Mediterraneibacter gnavus]|uniref:hypothetical protein n=2 Tax=Mediterraneibacter gnavus TaxID=33038 RepID=UPI0034A311EA